MKQRLVATVLMVVAAAVALLGSSISPIVKVSTQCPTALKQTITEIAYEPDSTGNYVAVLKERPITESDLDFKACHCSEKKKAEQTQASSSFFRVPPFLAPSVAEPIVFPMVSIESQDHVLVVEAVTPGTHTPPVPPPDFI